MSYKQIRAEVLKFMNGLQANRFSYQSICNHINNMQSDYVLYKDFFSRFRSKPNYYNTSARHKKLLSIHSHLQSFYLENTGKQDLIKNDLKILLKDAINAQFEVLTKKNSPIANLGEYLGEYFKIHSPAFLDIKNIILHKTQYNWGLDILHYGSFHKFINIDITHFFDKTAVLDTKEYWKLYWVDKTSNILQFKYEGFENRKYLTSVENDLKWKIIEIIAPASNNRIKPTYIDTSLINKLNTSNVDLIKQTIDDFLFKQEILYCIAYFKSLIVNISPSDQSFLNRIHSNYLNTCRLLNTDVVSIHTFNNEVSIIQKQLSLFLHNFFISNKDLFIEYET